MISFIIATVIVGLILVHYLRFMRKTKAAYMELRNKYNLQFDLDSETISGSFGFTGNFQAFLDDCCEEVNNTMLGDGNLTLVYKKAWEANIPLNEKILRMLFSFYIFNIVSRDMDVLAAQKSEYMRRMYTRIKGSGKLETIMEEIFSKLGPEGANLREMFMKAKEENRGRGMRSSVIINTDGKTHEEIQKEIAEKVAGFLTDRDSSQKAEEKIEVKPDVTTADDDISISEEDEDDDSLLKS